ncbi:membrane anchor subunit of succinate dehydrogenase, Sdh4 [Mucor velutinosus]|uniref:Membrane anchor subunit of succinate dehydrogenase, Sdh4 n=1 Tax=Mucor velutinosus TaxID=708070 RepID=A0AAN7I3Q2_9FUNG|nr:membrane anchor subunit of succinate dehydrogenase, Sdh4 [Mucor velutinosus]
MNSISSPYQQINYQIYTATTTSTISNSLKRKRIMKSVHFAERAIVLETYSSDEYDRSDIFSAPVLYKLNPTIQPPKLSLNIDNVPNLVRDSEDEECNFSSAENSPNTPPPCNSISNASKSIADHYFQQQQQQQQGMKKKKRPLLTVNTTMCADPLFFTSLTTNYKNESTTANNDFLVPVSAIDI